jgi:glycerophosphoryl diester phosphodiesterase
VLQLVNATGVSLLLDIKEGRTLDKAQVVQLIRRHNTTVKVIVGPRTLDDLAAFQALDSNLLTLGFIKNLEEIEPFVQAGVDIIRLWPKWIHDDPNLVTKVHQLGKSVWTTAGDASRQELESLIKLGVNGILSDVPELMDSLRVDLQ